MAIFVCSDLHLNHSNIIYYEPASRGQFKTVEEMNEALIHNWNSVISEEDIVYVCGDFFMGKLDCIEPVFKRLKGKIILIRGNHDTDNRLEILGDLGVTIKDIAYLQYKGKFFIFCHFPIESTEFVNMLNKNNSETIYLYGHIHNNAPKGYINGTYHVGVDTNNLTPISIEQIWRESCP